MIDSTVQPGDSIEALGWFSTRVLSALRRNGIRTMADLTACSADDITDIRNLGVRSLREVRELLARHGLALRTEEPPES